ncbi:PhzF family phenazine biosynthesis protein [Aquiflexum sp.]|uniref:PhzF family phenazine biosynthesis protein n=1 Tax=Aquiflexum sp. TaxID=1872584 RepID=UPI00359476F3
MKLKIYQVDAFVTQVFRGNLAAVENEDIIKNLQFDLHLISKIKARGVIVSALGKTVDFVSRFFGPQIGVPDDPVTGSAHTSSPPIWSKNLISNIDC